MIVLECPACGHKWNDYCGETASFSDDGEMIDYERYYQCPKCGVHVDMQESKIVNYNDLKKNR